MQSYICKVCWWSFFWTIVTTRCDDSSVSRARWERKWTTQCLRFPLFLATSCGNCESLLTPRYVYILLRVIRRILVIKITRDTVSDSWLSCINVILPNVHICNRVFINYGLLRLHGTFRYIETVRGSSNSYW